MTGVWVVSKLLAIDRVQADLRSGPPPHDIPFTCVLHISRVAACDVLRGVRIGLQGTREWCATRASYAASRGIVARCFALIWMRFYTHKSSRIVGAWYTQAVGHDAVGVVRALCGASAAAFLCSRAACRKMRRQCSVARRGICHPLMVQQCRTCLVGELIHVSRVVFTLWAGWRLAHALVAPCVLQRTVQDAHDLCSGFRAQCPPQLPHCECPCLVGSQGSPQASGCVGPDVGDVADGRRGR